MVIIARRWALPWYYDAIIGFRVIPSQAVDLVQPNSGGVSWCRNRERTRASELSHRKTVYLTLIVAYTALLMGSLGNVSRLIREWRGFYTWTERTYRTSLAPCGCTSLLSRTHDTQASTE